MQLQPATQPAYSRTQPALYAEGQPLRRYARNSGCFSPCTYVGPQAAVGAHLVEERGVGRIGADTQDLSPLLDARLELSSAYFFYGASSYDVTESLRLFTDDLAPQFPLLKGQTLLSATEGALRSQVNVLAAALAKMSSDTLTVAEVKQRGSFKVIDFSVVLAAMSDDDRAKAPAAITANPVSLVYHGNGFSVTWRPVKLDTDGYQPAHGAMYDSLTAGQ